MWVMGEHANDRTIEQMLDDEAQEKARVLAEKEAETLRLKEEEELKKKLRQEQIEIEHEREMTKLRSNANTSNEETSNFYNPDSVIFREKKAIMPEVITTVVCAC